MRPDTPAAPDGPLRPRLEAALRAALRARDPVARSALRSALAALDNATAVPVSQDQAVAGGPHVAGAVAGLGAAEAERRRLTEADLEAIVRAEIAERLAAASGYDQAGPEGPEGQAEAASRLRDEADVLRRVLSPGS